MINRSHFKQSPRNTHGKCITVLTSKEVSGKGELDDTHRPTSRGTCAPSHRATEGILCRLQTDRWV